MKQTITIKGHQITLESNAFTTLLYKKQFNKDYFKDISDHFPIIIDLEIE